MGPIEIILICIGASLALLVAVVALRTAAFKPKRAERREPERIAVNTERAASALSEMIKCKTVSHSDKTLDDSREFEKFVSLLSELFPKVKETCEFERVCDRALLFRWRGRGEGDPAVLMAHYDVVSAEESAWQKPPFSGEISDGYIWGRGALDTKGSLLGILSAAEELISEGVTPERDIYFAFGGNEEVNGDGAPSIVELFTSRGISPSLVLDEGGAVVSGAFPGVSAPAALIGIAEKGMANIEYSVSSAGGHSSSPKAHTPVGILSAACCKVENKPFRFTLTEASRKMLDTLGRHSTLLYRIIFANLRLFSPILSFIGKRSGGELNALLRTTTAFTQMLGSEGANVIPPVAKMVSNHRIISGETVESTVKRIRKTVKDGSVEIKAIGGMDPSPTSRTDSEGYLKISDAISEVWQDAIVSPYLMLACSDSRHWSRVSDKVYRFSPMALSGEERATIHGNDERIPISTLKTTVEFFKRLMMKL